MKRILLTLAVLLAFASPAVAQGPLRRMQAVVTQSERLVRDGDRLIQRSEDLLDQVEEAMAAERVAEMSVDVHIDWWAILRGRQTSVLTIRMRMQEEEARGLLEVEVYEDSEAEFFED